MTASRSSGPTGNAFSGLSLILQLHQHARVIRGLGTARSEFRIVVRKALEPDWTTTTAVQMAAPVRFF
jgi:hypothetical protein